MVYKRILLKLSGELLGGNESGSPFNKESLNSIARDLKGIRNNGIEIAIVLGGGNILRGKDVSWMHREYADRMGMMATVLNGLALKQALDEIDTKSIVMGSFAVKECVREFSHEEALKAIKNCILLFTGGTGNPYFSTDSAAALRGIQISADCLLKGTKVDGVYDRDPKKYKDAQRYSSISFREAIEKQLQIMDMTAFALCMENNLPVLVFDITKRGNLLKILSGEKIGTLVSGGGENERS
ncbi:MAG: UMP kinase [Candidatus Coatesbacteria bacterium]|nr:UMP kinase [Candidatus Coatesbacteria bacterium]